MIYIDICYIWNLCITIIWYVLYNYCNLTISGSSTSDRSSRYVIHVHINHDRCYCFFLIIGCKSYPADNWWPYMATSWWCKLFGRGVIRSKVGVKWLTGVWSNKWGVLQSPMWQIQYKDIPRYTINHPQWLTRNGLYNPSPNGRFINVYYYSLLFMSMSLW